MRVLGFTPAEEEGTLAGATYLQTLHKYLSVNINRLAPPAPGQPPITSPTFFQQSYTILTLGLDPTSSPLSRNVKVPLTLGFGTPQPPRPTHIRPLMLRLPPDRLLYLMLRWQSLPQTLPHVGRTDEAIAPGVPVAARGARVDGREKRADGDVQSVRSWVGSMRSVSLGSISKPGMGWFGRKEEVDEDQILLALYSVFTVLPALLIHPPFLSDPPIAELIDAGGYTQLGGIDVRVPLDVLRNLQTLELEGYDPRGLLIPPNPALRSLTVRNVQDGDDWLEELLIVLPEPTAGDLTPNPQADSPLPTPNLELPDSFPPRFPNIRHLSLHSTSLLNFASFPLPHLTNLDLSHNLLNALPSSLSSLSSLQALNLSNNLINSVRNAPSVLGNITSLNLAHNRIDCLIGLERVLGLERVDVRSNELSQWDEVGRLSVLPHLKEVWCRGNPLDTSDPKEEWRTELGVTFAKERNPDVIVDDIPWTWNETRRIETILQSRGIPIRQPRSRSRASSRQPHASSSPHVRAPQPAKANHTTGVASTSMQRESSGAGSSSLLVPPRDRSGNASPVLGVKEKEKKRRPRRVINLDEDNDVLDISKTSPLPGGTRTGKLPDNGDLPTRLNDGENIIRVKKKER